MGWTLGSVLFRLFNPSARDKRYTEFRFSQALNEAGRYEVDYPNWAPAAFEHDLPMKFRDTPKNGRKLYETARELIPDRAEAARGVLQSWGVVGGGCSYHDAEDWEQVEYALARRGELAVPPDTFPKDEVARLRPKYRAFLFDVGCLATEVALALRPGAVIAYAGDLDGVASDTPYPQCFPVVAKDGKLLAAAIETSLRSGRANAAPGERNTELSTMISLLKDPNWPPGEGDLEASVHQWLDKIVHETGALPDMEAFAAMMGDVDIAYDDVPESVFERLGVSEQER